MASRSARNLRGGEEVDALAEVYGLGHFAAEPASVTAISRENGLDLPLLYRQVLLDRFGGEKGL